MNDINQVIQTPLFAKQKKKLHKKQIQDLDKAVIMLMNQPEAGELKTGDLSGIRVFKFKSVNILFLLAYEVIGNSLCLYAIGAHENFYRDLKRYLNT